MRTSRLVLAVLLVPAAFTVAAGAPDRARSMSFRDYGSDHGWAGDDQCAKPLPEREGGWVCYEVDPRSDSSQHRGVSTPDWRQPGD